MDITPQRLARAFQLALDETDGDALEALRCLVLALEIMLMSAEEEAATRRRMPRSRRAKEGDGHVRE